MILVKKLLYMFGVLVALIFLVIAGTATLIGIQRGPWPSVLAAAVVACVSAGFIWFAHRQTKALEAERHERERSESAAVLDAALARRISDSRFVARRKLLWLAVATALVAMFVGGAVLTWSAGAYVPAGLLTLLAGMMLWFLLPALANREAIVVDVRGIELPGRYDVIPWKAIHEAYFSTYELRGARVAEARLGVRDGARYRRSRWALSLGTGSGDQVVVPLRGLDQTPETIFAAIRQFHERAVPKGTLTGGGGYYRVDPGAARLESIHKRILEIGEEMKAMADGLDRSGPVADDSPAIKAFERESESRLKEMEALGTESSRLLSEQTRELESRMALARRSLARLRWIAYAFIAFAALIAAIKILGR
jgi:hypothetical protein